uniref:Uncharacterized protein n=1 Tax=Anopheles merus TaxID=30066 RepID=A0A182VFY2_ANOME
MLTMSVENPSQPSVALGVAKQTSQSLGHSIIVGAELGVNLAPYTRLHFSGSFDVFIVVFSALLNLLLSRNTSQPGTSTPNNLRRLVQLKRYLPWKPFIRTLSC